jgi:glucose/arabinose dehydrogenase
VEFRTAFTGAHEMMTGVFHRILFTTAAIAIAAAGSAPLAHADPPQCPASGCPHLPANNPPPGPSALPATPPANVNSPSYRDGYKTEHDYFAIPQNHTFLASEIKAGYTTATACQLEMGGGPAPQSPTDWLAGCVDAMHDLGFRP